MDDVDLQRWSIQLHYAYHTEDCIYDGTMFMSRWIHHPQEKINDVPNLTEGDKDTLAAWLDAYPMKGMYIAVNGELLSINPGSESQGGHDIQEKMPPDETPDGEEFTAPQYTPSGRYLYFDDRNAPVRYDKQVVGSDQAWNFDCVAPGNGGNMRISLTAKSLDDFAAAPATHCQGKRPQVGIEGTNRGRVVISANNTLIVFDSELGRMDIDATRGCRLR